MGKLSGNIENFTFTVSGGDFKLARVDGEEGLSTLYAYRLHLVSEDPDIDLAALIAKAGVVKFISEGDNTERYVHGMIAGFEIVDQGKRLTTYSALLVPRVWTLTQMADCRIFQNVKTPDIIKKILDDAKIPSDHYKIDCKETYEPRDYCVQYRETDWNFISRLMAEEGIFFFFEHSADKHVMVIADKAVIHKDIEKPATVIFQKPGGQVAAEDTVYPFSYAEGVRTGSVMLNDYMFRKPTLNLRQKQDFKVNTELEVYDYAGRYPVTDKGDDATATGARLAKARMESAQVSRYRGSGNSDCMRLTAGYRFKLDKHPRKALNQDWLLTRVEIHADQPSVYEEGATGKPSTYANSFGCIPAATPFRAPFIDAKPTIHGAQTAIVTGPSGEEIYVDEFGRVKVQFHWDREGKKDEKSSCWIRVSQLWAGAGWGAMFIPRIGQEVIVDFIEGDPDRPIITGRVYHGTNLPPYKLPDDKTKSTIKSDSSKGGGGSNELRFEDKKGSEEVFLHAQKDWTIAVENDKNQTVGHDETLDVTNNRTKTVGVDQSETIGSNKTISVGANHDETIGANKTMNVGANHTETIAANMSLTVGSNKTETVGVNSAETIGAAKELTIGAAYQVTVGAAMNETVGAAKAEEVGAVKSVSVGADSSEDVGGTKSVNAGKDITESAGKKMVLSAGDQVDVQCGKATITMKKDGTITIKGKDITVDASGKINIKAGGEIVIKGSKIIQN
jgi:type VI secretion system secreted protein VgrG